MLSVSVSVCLCVCVTKCPPKIRYLEIFRKKIFFFKIMFFLKFFDFDFGNEEKYFYGLLFYCLMGNAQKISTLEIFRKKFFFSNFLFFSNSLISIFKFQKKYFYCLLSHGQRPKNLYLRDFSKNNFFSKIFFFKSQTQLKYRQGLKTPPTHFFFLFDFSISIFRFSAYRHI